MVDGKFNRNISIFTKSKLVYINLTMYITNLIYGKTICPNKFLQIFFLRFKEEVGKYFNI